MYVIVCDDRENKDLLESAKERGLKIFKLGVCASEIPNSYSVSEFLSSLGLKPQLKGFKYMKYILENGLDCSAGITTHIYPVVAKAFNVTPMSIERNIRHLVRSGVYTNDSIKLCEKVFGSFEHYPTNHHFVQACSLYLKENPIL